MRKLSALLVAMFLLSSAFAQGVRKVTADKIVGIVGDKIILKSDVYNDINDRARRGEPVPANANCYIMEQLLTLKALVLQADKDSIIVGEDEIDALLDNQIRGFINMYGSKEALEQVAGRSIYQIKEDFRQSFTERKKAEKMRDKITDGVKITPQEVKEYYDKIPKDSLRFYESEIEISEVVLYPKPSRELELLAIDELGDFKRQAEAGTQKFETLAQLYTEDPGSKETGGRYAINRTERQWDPAFIQNAFRLKEGQISPVFKSRFGYHIIKMESRAGDDAIVRHILRIPKITEAEINNAVNTLDSVRAKLIAGTMNFGEAVNKYSEDEGSKFTGGRRLNQSGGSSLPMDQLDKELVEFLVKSGLKPGEVSKPNVFAEERGGKKGVRLVFLKSRTDPHRENLKDDYDRVASRAIEEKKQGVLEKWFQAKIGTFYLMIDDDFKTCESMNNWLQYAVKNTN
ncbi:peptidylprolyl isomerase [Pseudoflavitalea sp. G-6-1-2]|uniref:peptidylprolyl isomerase n=1 Tax=Pseudoflavitalea sp. G-6-1-2 TaxID=2728841 RepID=UPI00146B8258|nr:peptidylprolyl isomerase [Pseudoflavitalea sp. G-6-1-2]NML20142.1 peptidylprolyl isomerase [Pseudoflavitalea sp. G-6-1-2]